MWVFNYTGIHDGKAIARLHYRLVSGPPGPLYTSVPYEHDAKDGLIKELTNGFYSWNLIK